MGKEATEPRLIISDLRGGRNGTEPPLTLREASGGVEGSGGECVEALNVDWWNASLCRKRSGATAMNVTGPLTGTISFLGRHVPGVDETKAELWAADDAATPVIAVQRPSAGAAFVAPPISDPVTGKGWDVQGLSFKGKYFLAYDSGKPRLHVYDPATNTIRATGLAAPLAVVSVTNGGSGTYPAVQRWYRLRTYVLNVSTNVLTRYSEPGPSTAFTPSGTGANATITLPAPPGEGETFFSIEGSSDGVTFYILVNVPVGTATYADTILVSNYGFLSLSQATGTYNLQRSYRFLAVDNNRILGFGSFTPTDPQSRLEFSAITGSTNIADEERVPLTNYLDLDDADSGNPTGLIGPVYGSYYVFKYRQTWKLTPTGNAGQPYNVYPISKIIGAIHQNAIDIGEDASGNPVIYFMSTRGPYRLGLNGLEYLGLPVEDLILGPTLQINPDSTTVVAHAVYHTAKRQFWLWYATLGNNDPVVKLMYDVRRSAWARHTGPSARARCSLMFARVIGASNSHDMKPYIGQIDSAHQIWRCDDDSVGADASTPFQAYVLTKPYLLGGLGAYCTVAQGTLIAPAASGVQLVQQLIRDCGKETQTSTVSLTPVGSESRVMRLIDAGSMAGCWAIQFLLGDAAAVTNQWAIDVVTVNYLKDQAAV